MENSNYLGNSRVYNFIRPGSVSSCRWPTEPTDLASLNKLVFYSAKMEKINATFWTVCFSLQSGAQYKQEQPQRNHQRGLTPLLIGARREALNFCSAEVIKAQMKQRSAKIIIHQTLPVPMDELPLFHLVKQILQQQVSLLFPLSISPAN